MSEDTPSVATVQWNQSIETMLASYADNAKCFEWMHTEAYTLYNSRTRIIMITINVFTALGGLSNVIAGGQTVNGFQFAWIFGSLSILITLFNMLQEKLAYAQMTSEFHQYAISWGSISRKIVEELAIPPVSRQHCESFLKNIRQDINQVSVAGNAKIPEAIRDACYKKFKNIPNFDLPDICGHIEHTRVYSTSEDTILTPLLTPQ